jgi:hypothetical protein
MTTARRGTGRKNGKRSEPASGEPPDPLEQLLSLAEAAEISGLAAHTLAQQAQKRRLRAKRVGRTWVTTQALLQEYLASRWHTGEPLAHRRAAAPGARQLERTASPSRRGA